MCLPSSMERIKWTQYQAALASRLLARHKSQQIIWWAWLEISLRQKMGKKNDLFYKKICNNSPVYLYEHIPHQRIPIYHGPVPKRNEMLHNKILLKHGITWNNIGDCQQAPEDNSFHFLLRCNLYANCRQTLQIIIWRIWW